MDDKYKKILDMGIMAGEDNGINIPGIGKSNLVNPNELKQKPAMQSSRQSTHNVSSNLNDEIRSLFNDDELSNVRIKSLKSQFNDDILEFLQQSIPAFKEVSYVDINYTDALSYNTVDALLSASEELDITLHEVALNKIYSNEFDNVEFYHANNDNKGVYYVIHSSAVVVLYVEGNKIVDTKTSLSGNPFGADKLVKNSILKVITDSIKWLF